MSTLNILATDQLQTQLSLLGTGGKLRSAYTPYGYRVTQAGAPALGFTGGRLIEPEMGWCLLGNVHEFDKKPRKYEKDLVGAFLDFKHAAALVVVSCRAGVHWLLSISRNDC